MNDNLKSVLNAKLNAREKKGQLRRLTVFEDRNYADFSSNDYLSLSKDRELYLKFLAQLKHDADKDVEQSNGFKGGTGGMALGSGGSRLLDGNSMRVEHLERKILPQFHNAPDGLLFGSGFDANVGIYSAIARPVDVFVYDELVHASAHDGMRLARAGRRIPFAHNDVAALRAVLTELSASRDSNTGQRFNGHVFVGIESVYSMDGDIAPLAEILRAVKDIFPHTGHLIVDEAHATGVIGPNGRGLVSALGLESQVLVRVHTFGKGVGAAGAVVLCDSALREYFINYCRPFVYSTAMPRYAIAAIEVAYSFLQSPACGLRQAQLWALIHRFHAGLSLLSEAPVATPERRLCYDAAGLEPLSAIFAVQSPEARTLAAYCRQAARCVVRPIVYPTVPRGRERVRVCLHAGNTIAQVDALLAALKSWAEGGVKIEESKEYQAKL